MDELRQGGMVTGGPAPMTPKDRSRFLTPCVALLTGMTTPEKGMPGTDKVSGALE
jgi:hypothetical protein